MSALALGHRAFESARILWATPFVVRVRGVLQAVLAALLLAALVSWNPADPSLNAASSAPPTNWLGLNGALFADLFMQSLGLAAWPAALLLIAFGLAGAIGDAMQQRLKPTAFKAFSATAGVLALSAALSALAPPAAWPLATGLGGLWGDGIVGLMRMAFAALRLPGAAIGAGVLFLPLALWGIGYAIGLRFSDLGEAVDWARGGRYSTPSSRHDDIPPAGRDLDEDAAHLESVEQQVVGPLHRDTAGGDVVERFGEGQPSEQRQPRGERMPQRVAHEHRQRQRGSPRRNPRPVEPTATRRLIEGEQRGERRHRWIGCESK